MKKFTVLLSVLFIFGAVASAGATPITFDLAGSAGGSAVTISEHDLIYNANLTASLANDLDHQYFTLLDGDTRTVDFFTLTASGFGLGTYSISATLGFDLPDLVTDPSGSGGGYFGTLWGFISGGSLYWDTNSLPDYYTLANGNRICVAFEDGVAFGLGDTAMVHAYITNLGGSSAPVPEPGTLLMLGGGLVGLYSFGRRRIKG